MAVSDRIIVMKNAKIAQEGSPHDLDEHPNSAFIADFIGDANLVDCEVLESIGQTTGVRLKGKTISVPGTRLRKGNAKLVLRPHQIDLSRTATPASFPAEVTYAAYLGNQIQDTLEGPLGSLFVTSALTTDAIAVGDSVFIAFDQQHTRLVP